MTDEKRNVEIAAARDLRGKALKIIEAAGELGASVELIKLAVNQRSNRKFNNDDVGRAVDYLRGKGFVTVKEYGNERSDDKSVIAWITAEGVDFVEGVSNCEGVGL